MKRAIVAGVFLLANVVEPAMAQISVLACANAGHGSNMTVAQINTLLNPGAGIYACYNTVSFGHAGTRENNESLVGGGNFQDYKKGGSDPKDPTKILGTYTIGLGNYGGQIVYHYTGGGAFAYLICTDASTAPEYYFIRVPSGQVLNVYVTPSPGTC